MNFFKKKEETEVKRVVILKPAEEDPVKRNVVEYVEDPNYSPPRYEIERDPGGFLVSFSVEQQAEYTQFFRRFGFVIIRDVLSREECQKTIDDIWNYIESFKWTGFEVKEDERTIRRTDPNTWRLWPHMKEEGIVGYFPVFSQQALINRANPNVHRVYSNLLGRDDLYINHDRYGFFRPTKDVPHPYPIISPHHQNLEAHKSDTSIHKEYKSYENWKTFRNLHLDMNPFQYLEANSNHDRTQRFKRLTYENTNDFMHENNEPGTLADPEIHIQGLINLVDNLEDDGGFLLVPGMANHLEEWAKHNANLKAMNGTKQTFFIIPDSNSIHSQAIRITARAGSLILWDQRTAHGSSFNHSDRVRMAQFIKMFPSDLIPKDILEKRSTVIKKTYQENVPETTLAALTSLQRKTLGFDLY